MRFPKAKGWMFFHVSDSWVGRNVLLTDFVEDFKQTMCKQMTVWK